MLKQAIIITIGKSLGLKEFTWRCFHQPRECACFSLIGRPAENGPDCPNIDFWLVILFDVVVLDEVARDDDKEGGGVDDCDEDITLLIGSKETCFLAEKRDERNEEYENQIVMYHYRLSGYSPLLLGP